MNFKTFCHKVRLIESAESYGGCQSQQWQQEIYETDSSVPSFRIHIHPRQVLI